jgi:hypothetical protein
MCSEDRLDGAARMPSEVLEAYFSDPRVHCPDLLPYHQTGLLSPEVSSEMFARWRIENPNFRAVSASGSEATANTHSRDDASLSKEESSREDPLAKRSTDSSVKDIYNEVRRALTQKKTEYELLVRNVATTTSGSSLVGRVDIAASTSDLQLTQSLGIP